MKLTITHQEIPVLLEALTFFTEFAAGNLAPLAEFPAKYWQRPLSGMNELNFAIQLKNLQHRFAYFKMDTYVALNLRYRLQQVALQPLPQSDLELEQLEQIILLAACNAFAQLAYAQPQNLAAFISQYFGVGEYTTEQNRELAEEVNKLWRHCGFPHAHYTPPINEEKALNYQILNQYIAPLNQALSATISAAQQH